MKEKIDKEAFAKRLLIKTEVLGLSPTDLASELKLKRQTVDHWFQGRSAPGAQRMSQLAKRLGVSVSWLKRGITILSDIETATLEQIKTLAAMAPQTTVTEKNTQTTSKTLKEAHAESPESPKEPPESTIVTEDIPKYIGRERRTGKDRRKGLVYESTDSLAEMEKMNWVVFLFTTADIKSRLWALKKLEGRDDTLSNTPTREKEA